MGQGANAVEDEDVEPVEPPREGTWVRVGPNEVRVDDAVYAWTEPRFHMWSGVLPLLLIPPGLHVLLHDHEANAVHSHTWLWAFGAVWLLAWLLAVPYRCHVAYKGGRVDVVSCATRGSALRLASQVRKAVGAPG